MFRNIYICFFEFQTREKHFVLQHILIAENAAEMIRLKTEPELRISRQLNWNVNRGPPNACRANILSFYTKTKLNK